MLTRAVPSADAQRVDVRRCGVHAQAVGPKGDDAGPAVVDDLLRDTLRDGRLFGPVLYDALQLVQYRLAGRVALLRLVKLGVPAVR